MLPKISYAAYGTLEKTLSYVQQCLTSCVYVPLGPKTATLSV